MTQVTKHTPAPWFYEQSSLGEICVYDRTGGIVAGDVFKGDARLIAAAPELLEACERTLALARNNTVADISMLEAAIAKATKGE